MIRVSTIIPVYNGATTIAAAIDSALAQEFDGQEIIVVNDGSTDGTAEILAGYGDRVRVIDRPNAGSGPARNTGIANARGDLIAMLDADDRWLPGRLSRTIEALQGNRPAVLAFSDYMRADRWGALLERSSVGAPFAHPPSMDELLAHWWPIAPTTVTMRRDAWERCGGFSTIAGFEDLDLFIRAREFGEFEFLAEPLAVFRINNPDVGPDKWSPDNFIRLIVKRYGARACGLVAAVRLTYAHAFAAKALREMDQGHRAEAFRCWRRVIRYDPLYLLQAAHLGRLLRPWNLRRVAKMLLPKPRAQ
ncbi:MAG: glycosyltransferase [Candidatus Binataceae bacterium]|nr:glycosyltransferase [Candidatus Binataceae bacterium]